MSNDASGATNARSTGADAGNLSYLALGLTQIDPVTDAQLVFGYDEDTREEVFNERLSPERKGNTHHTG